MKNMIRLVIGAALTAVSGLALILTLFRLQESETSIIVMMFVVYGGLLFLGYRLLRSGLSGIKKNRTAPAAANTAAENEPAKKAPLAVPEGKAGVDRQVPENIPRKAEEKTDGTGAPDGKIGLEPPSGTKTVTPGHSFFTGLLPGETPHDGESRPGPDEPAKDGLRLLYEFKLPGRRYEYSYDPKYRRFLEDIYESDSKTAEEFRYRGRKAILPLDLIDRLNRYPEDRNPVKTARIRQIQQIMTEEEGFAPEKQRDA